MIEPADTSARPAGHVFLSYARADRERVRPIVEALESTGRAVWWDFQLVGGAAFAREIEAAPPTGGPAQADSTSADNSTIAVRALARADDI